MRTLRVMADYCSTGLWELGLGGVFLSIDADELSKELQARLDAWQAVYDTNPSWEGDTLMQDYDFMQEGYQIAALVKQELSDCRVLFYNDGYFDLVEVGRGCLEIGCLI